jgi:hypothetical protein
LFDTVRIWEFSPVWTDFDKCHNLSKRNVKLILKILSDLEPLRVSSNKKTLYSTRSCVNWAFFGTRGPLKRSFHSRFKLALSCQKRPNLHTNSLNKLLFLSTCVLILRESKSENTIISPVLLLWKIHLGEGGVGSEWKLCTGEGI